MIGSTAFFSEKQAGKPEYFYHPSFEEPAKEQEILCGCSPGELLSAQEEYHLFRQMNYMKFKAAQSAGEQWLQQATSIRNHIICCNLRLARKVGKRLSRKMRIRYRDIESDVYMSLMLAVEKFDFCRGTKFSTYATNVILKQSLRFRGAHKRQVSIRSVGCDRLTTVQDKRESPCERLERAEQARRNLDELMRVLKPRYRRVIREINGVGSDPKTLKEVGFDMGISEERARQIKARGMELLHERAKDLQLV